MNLCISQPAYRLGEPRPVAELPELAGDAAGLGYLRSLGIEQYARAERPLAELMREAAAEALDSAGCAPLDIGAIVYASSRYDPHSDLDSLPVLAQRLGMDRAVPYGVFLGQCANFSHALTLARALIELEGRGPVLVIIADALPSLAGRILARRTSVLSDGACAFVAGGRAQVRVHGLITQASPALVALDPMGGLLAFIEGVSQGFRSTCAAGLDAAGLGAEAYRWLLVGNYNLAVQRNFTALAGFADAQLFSANRSRFAHSFAADQMIALADLLSSDQLQVGQRAFCVGTGHHLWSAMSLERLP
ncbi:MAG: hypothetical protein ABWY06_04530 [Pseudomonas sp.]|uniref:hypothetical protein n=1 Tax=Pseudomonas sp. TaxID=306 RepID=UPI003397BFF2